MILEDLTRIVDHAAEITALESKLRQAKADLAAAKKQASAVYQSGRRLESLPHISRLMHLVSSLTSKLQAARAKSDKEKMNRDAHAKLSNIDREQVKANNQTHHGESISQGYERWNKLYVEYGGKDGLASEVYRRAMQQTNGGQQLLDVVALSHDLGVTWRQLYRKLETEARYAPTAQLMPKNK